jgi:hypothetical protein
MAGHGNGLNVNVNIVEAYIDVTIHWKAPDHGALLDPTMHFMKFSQNSHNPRAG